MYTQCNEIKTVIGASCKAQENVWLVPSEIGVKRSTYVRLMSTKYQ